MANYFAHTVTTEATKVLDADNLNREVFLQISGPPHDLQVAPSLGRLWIYSLIRFGV